MTNRRTTIILVAFFIILAAIFMTYYYKTTREQPKQLLTIGEPGHHVDSFAFYNQDGRLITNKDVNGKVYVVEYFFSTCKGQCPKMTENMTKVYKAYHGNPDVLILSHTVDPVHDTVPALKAYSRRFDADSKQWMFLTGDKKKLYDMARWSYLISAQDDTAGVSVDQDFIHDQHFVLVDRTGHIRGNSDGYDGLRPSSVDTLISDIRVLLDEKN